MMAQTRLKGGGLCALFAQKAELNGENRARSADKALLCRDAVFAALHVHALNRACTVTLTTACSKTERKRCEKYRRLCYNGDMKTPIDFGKEFLYRLFDQRDADACQKMLAGDLVWITPENMHHFLSEGAVLKFLRKQIKQETESRYVDLISIKSSPSADNIMTVAYEINLVSREEERPLYLRCSMAICRRSRQLEITFLHFSKKSERDSSEQLRGFIDNLPCGVMILACLDGRREQAIYYNEFFAHRLRYKQDEFARAMEQNPFFMASEEDRDRIQEEIAEARKNGGSITANLRFYRRDGNSFYYRMKGAPAYQADGGTVYYCVFQETTGFRITADRLQERLDSATEILRQIPEAICGIEYPPGTMLKKAEEKDSAGENAAASGGESTERTDSTDSRGKTAPEQAVQEDGDVKIYRGRRRENTFTEKTAAAKAQAVKISNGGPRVFFTSKNIPSMFGVSNSVYMKNILEDPFYGLELTSITRDRLLTSYIFNPDKTATGKAVSCGIFRVKRPDQADEKAVRVELMVRRVREKDGTMRLYLFYYDREAAQKEMETRVDRAMKMGRAGQEQLRADLKKAKENAASKLGELSISLKEAEKKHAEEMTRIEYSLSEEKKRGALMSRQLEEARTAQKQIAAERDRVEEDAARRIRNHEARAQRQVKEACSARSLLEEQLREAQQRSRQLEQQLQREKSRRLLLEEQLRQLREQNEERQKEQTDGLYTDRVKITEAMGPAILPAATLQSSAAGSSAGSMKSAATMQLSATMQPPATMQPSATLQPSATMQPSAAMKLSASLHSPISIQPSKEMHPSASIQPSKEMQSSAVMQPSETVIRQGDWMTRGRSLKVFSSMGPADDGEEEQLQLDTPAAPAASASPGKTVLREEAFSPESFIRDIMVYEDSICSDREITLRLYLDSRFPSNVYGYASLLRQALCEIIENAVGRARTGGIISVHCRADRPSGGLVNLYFRIDDDGKRIPETGMQAMFEAEDPADAASAGRPGLYAAQEAAALMGGSLNARSSSGSTRFLLTVALRVR